MIEDRELIKQLHLLNRSPGFVFRENGATGSLEVSATPEVPDSDGIYWVAGSCRLKSGVEVDAVFRVDTNAGGSLQSVFWQINGAWFEHSDPDAIKGLGLSRDDAFPFDWTYRSKLRRDLYHD